MLIGAPFGSIQLFDPAALVSAWRVAAGILSAQQKN